MVYFRQEFFSAMISNIAKLKGTNNRVLFQNADGNINMGIWFKDPDIETYEIFWLNALAREMAKSLDRNDGLVTVDEEINIRSCYVELHRNRFQSLVFISYEYALL